jgi:ElaB/YqjD/DUF883 family membrane-anchored ribosome-binding protein
MKHILNNLSEEEKNAIREQHTGGMTVMTEKFSKLTESKLGDSKPFINEQEGDLEEGMFDKKSSNLKELENDIHRVLSQKVSRATPSGEQGNWHHSVVEKSLDRILDDLEDIIREYRKKSKLS